MKGKSLMVNGLIIILGSKASKSHQPKFICGNDKSFEKFRKNNKN